MMFLVRTAFWLMILVLLLPTDEQQQSEVYGTAEAAVKDVSGFCGRNPGVCEKGMDAFGVFMHKAQFGAQMLMGFVKEQTGASGASDMAAPAPEPRPAPAAASWEQAPSQETQAPATTVSSQDTLNQDTLNQDTLNPDDLAPAWGQPRHAGT